MSDSGEQPIDQVLEDGFRSAIGAPSRKEIEEHKKEKRSSEFKMKKKLLAAQKRQELFADPTIDIITKEQLAKEADALVNSWDLDRDLKAFDNAIASAKAGKGIYGINRKNAELVRQMQDRPGRQQTILTQGAKEVSGTESTGILTGFQK